MLRATAGNTKNNNPEENFESRAPAKVSPKSIKAARPGDCHSFGICHTVKSQNRAITISVITSGPNARNAGVVAKNARHNSPPQSPPRRLPIAYRANPNSNVTPSMGSLAHQMVLGGSFQRIRNQYPKTHSARYWWKNWLPLKVHEICE